MTTIKKGISTEEKKDKINERGTLNPERVQENET